MVQPSVASITASEGQPASLLFLFTAWRGWVPGITEIPDRFRRVGQRGSGRQSMGQESPATDVEVMMLFSDQDTALINARLLESIVGYDVEVEDCWTRRFTASIDAVRCRLVATRGPLVGGGRATVRLEATIRMERQGDDQDVPTFFADEPEDA